MSNSGETLSELRELSPEKFEQFVAELWEERGWETAVSDPGADRGIDVMASRQFPYEEKIAIQAKRYGSNSRVGGPDIQQYAALKQNSGIDQVVIVTTGEFTTAAQNRAEELNVKCIDGKRLVDFIGELDAEGIVEEFTQAGSPEKTDQSRSASISTPDITVEVLSLLKGNEISDYSTLSQADLEDQLRGGGLSDRKAAILEVESVDSRVQFDTHDVTFGSEAGHEYDGANAMFVGFYEQSLENQFSRFFDSISPKQTKRYICVTESIPDSVEITSIDYSGEFSFSLDFEEQADRLLSADANEVL